MSTAAERHEARLREYIVECWEKGNVDRLDEFVSANYVEHNPAAPDDIEGIDGHRANIEQYRRTFPDMRVDLELVVAADRYTAQLLTGSGTHEGEFMGVPPTGETVEFMGAGFTEWEDGKMIEDWSVIDLLSIMQQLGMVESPG